MKKFLAILMSAVIAITTTAFVYAADHLDIECQLSESSVEIGDTFFADFKVTDNENGYNNITTYVHYDPNVIRAVKCETSDIPSDIIIKRDSNNIAHSLFSWKFTNGRITFVPSLGDSDYEGYADGVKTAAEIGIIKLTNYLDYAVDNLLQNYEGTGTLVRIKFEAVGNGSTSITFEDTDASYFVDGISHKLTVNCSSGYVSVGDGSDSKPTTEITTTESTTELTTEPTTEATTESTTEPTTEATTESTTEPTTAEPTTEDTSSTEPTTTSVMGDVNNDGILNRNDLLRLGKYFAGWSVDIIESLADVNGDGVLNRNDLLRLGKYFAGWDVTIGE